LILEEKKQCCRKSVVGKSKSWSAKCNTRKFNTSTHKNFHHFYKTLCTWH